MLKYAKNKMKETLQNAVKHTEGHKILLFK